MGTNNITSDVNSNLLKAIYYLYSRLAYIKKDGSVYNDRRYDKKDIPKGILYTKKDGKTINNISGTNYAEQNPFCIPLDELVMDVAGTSKRGTDYIILYKEDDLSHNFKKSELIRVKNGVPQSLSTLVAAQKGMVADYKHPKKKLTISEENLNEIIDELRQAYAGLLRDETSLPLTIMDPEIGHKVPRLINLGIFKNTGDLFENVLRKYPESIRILNSAGDDLWNHKFSAPCAVSPFYTDISPPSRYLQ